MTGKILLKIVVRYKLLIFNLKWEYIFYNFSRANIVRSITFNIYMGNPIFNTLTQIYVSSDTVFVRVGHYRYKLSLQVISFLNRREKIPRETNIDTFPIDDETVKSKLKIRIIFLVNNFIINELNEK